jgi:hypothetical protein
MYTRVASEIRGQIARIWSSAIMNDPGFAPSSGLSAGGGE